MIVALKFRSKLPDFKARQIGLPKALIVQGTPRINFRIYLQGDYIKRLYHGARGLAPAHNQFIECKVSGVSVQDMLLRLSFLTPETRHLKPNSRNKNG